MGKRSCSTLIICRFMGMAVTTPRRAIIATQGSIWYQGITSPVSIITAGMAATVPPPVM